MLRLYQIPAEADDMQRVKDLTDVQPKFSLHLRHWCLSWQRPKKSLVVTRKMFSTWEKYC